MSIESSARMPQWRGLALWIAFGVLGFSAYVATHNRAFPEADIPIGLDRREAIARAESVLTELGHDAASYRRSASFECNFGTREFLEKELSAKEANRLMREEVATWYWFVRFVIPGQEEEFQVSLWPDGRLAYFYHHQPETAPGASPSREAAMELAEQFIRERTHIRFEGYTLLQDSQQSRPNRLEHYFTWKRWDFNLRDAKYLVSVSVSGDRVSHYSEGLDIPEAWQRESRRIAAQRGLLAQVAQFATQVLGIGSIVALFLLVRAGEARFRVAIWLGAIAATLSILAWVNSLPAFWLGYSTTDSVWDHLGTQLITLASAVVLSPVMTAILLVPAEGLTRRVFPGHIELSRGLTLSFWQSRATLTAVVVGFSLAFMHGALIQLLYLGVKPLGVWSPQAAPYHDALDSAMPWLGALITGVLPALREEIFYRMFLIGFVYWSTKRMWLAVLVSAVAWGFSHTHYPQEPTYFRGLELTAVGILYGIVYLRYGVIATMVSHYVYNTATSSWFLFNSEVATLQFSAVVIIGVALLPAAPGVWAWLRARTMLSADEVNALPYGRERTRVPIEATPPEPPTEYVRVRLLQTRTLVILAAVGALGLAADFLLPQGEYFGDWIRVSVTREDVIARASDFLDARGVNSADYHAVASFSNALNSEATDYVWQQVGERELNRIWRERFRDEVRWSVRYFKPQSPEEYFVNVSVVNGGAVIDYWHVLPEDAAGASLTNVEAQELAEQYLRGTKGIQLESYKLVDSSTHDRPNRRDHWFAWEDTSFAVGDAKFRVWTNVIGDEALYAPSYIQVPDAWSRARQERTVWDLIGTALGAAIGIALVGAWIWVFVVLLRRHVFRFRDTAICALLAPALSICGSLNSLPWFWSSYSTSTEAGVYAVRQVLSWFVSQPAIEYAGMFIGVAFASALYRYVFPQQVPLLAWAGCDISGTRTARRSVNLRGAWGDALIVGVSVTGILLGIGAITRAVPFDWPPEGRSIRDSAPIAQLPGIYNAAVPAIYWITDAVETAAIFASAVAVFGSLYVRWIRTVRRLYAVSLVIASLGIMANFNPSESLVETLEIPVVLLLLIIPAVFLFTRLIARNNIAMYIAVVFSGEILPEMNLLVQDSTSFLRLNVGALYAVIAGMMALGIWLRAGRRGDVDTDTQAK